ncbi:MAG: metallophosphoesterase family protein [Planctomycetota bacterium]|jgi:alkaline phosphatase
MTRDTPRSTRREFLKAAASGIGTAGLVGSAGRLEASEKTGPALAFGLVTDVHYADAPTRGSRHYRDSLAKLRQAVETFSERRLPFAIELGDFIDAGPDRAKEIEYLRRIDEVYRSFQGERHYVLGNHCLNAFTKDEFLAHCGARVKKSFYSFDVGPFHFVVLDANYRRDGAPYAAGGFSWTDTWIPRDQQEWLAADLKRAGDKKAFLFVHQNLHDEKDPHGVKNASEVREVLRSAGNVVAVFQGHMHSGGYTKVGGIHYATLKAMVEGSTLANNAYAVVTLDASGNPVLEGHGREKSLAFR